MANAWVGLWSTRNYYTTSSTQKFITVWPFVLVYSPPKILLSFSLLSGPQVVCSGFLQQALTEAMPCISELSKKTTSHVYGTLSYHTLKIKVPTITKLFSWIVKCINSRSSTCRIRCIGTFSSHAYLLDVTWRTHHYHVLSVTLNVVWFSGMKCG